MDIQLYKNEFTNQNTCLLRNVILTINNKDEVTIILNKNQENIDNVSFSAYKGNMPLEHDNLIRFEHNDLDINVSEKKGIWILIGKYVANNAGHVLQDEVFACWQALKAFKLEEYAYNANIITNNKGKFVSIFKSLTSKDVNYIDNMINKNKYIKLEVLIVGMASHGYGDTLLGYRPKYLPPFSETLESFRKHSYKILNIKENTSKRNILFIDKHNSSAVNKSAIYNIDKLFDKVSEKFKSHSVKKLCWQGMTIKEQVQEMASADILISLPGCDLSNCVFLNPNSLIITPHRFEKREGKVVRVGSNEIDKWFAYTHKYVLIKDVTLIEEDNIYYSKINNEDIIIKHIEDFIV